MMYILRRYSYKWHLTNFQCILMSSNVVFWPLPYFFYCLSAKLEGAFKEVSKEVYFQTRYDANLFRVSGVKSNH